MTLPQFEEWFKANIGLFGQEVCFCPKGHDKNHIDRDFLYLDDGDLYQTETGYQYVDYHDEEHPITFPDAESVKQYFSGLHDGYDDEHGGTPASGDVFYMQGYEKTVKGLEAIDKKEMEREGPSL